LARADLFSTWHTFRVPPTHPNIKLPSRAVAVWSKLLTQALGSGSTCGSTWLRQKMATARIAPAASAAGPFALRRSVLHRASVRGLFRSPRHQTAADHKRQQDGNKDSQFQIVHHALLRVGEERLSQGRGDSQPLWIDNAAINAAVPNDCTACGRPRRWRGSLPRSRRRCVSQCRSHWLVTNSLPRSPPISCPLTTKTVIPSRLGLAGRNCRPPAQPVVLEVTRGRSHCASLSRNDPLS